MKRSVWHRHPAITLLVLTLLFLSGTSNFGQRNPDRELPLRELLNVPGKLVSEAKSARPTNELKLTGYRVEEIKLPRQLNVELRGQQVAVDKAWRVTVQGGLDRRSDRRQRYRERNPFADHCDHVRQFSCT